MSKKLKSDQEEGLPLKRAAVAVEDNRQCDDNESNENVVDANGDRVYDELWFPVCRHVYAYAKTEEEIKIELYLKNKGTALAHGPKPIELRDLPVDDEEDADHKPYYVVGRFFYDYVESRAFARSNDRSDTFMVLVDRPRVIVEYDNSRCHAGPITLHQFQRCELCVDPDPDYTEQRHIRAYCAYNFEWGGVSGPLKFYVEYQWTTGMRFKRDKSLRAEFECTDQAMYNKLVRRAEGEEDDDRNRIDTGDMEDPTAAYLFGYAVRNLGYREEHFNKITMTRMYFVDIVDIVYEQS